MMAAKKASSWLVEVALALVILTIGAVVICKLLGLCRRLNTPRKPDKDDNASAPNIPAGLKPDIISIDHLLDESCFGSIDDQSDDFKTASGTFYTGMMSALIQTSTDLKVWTPSGSITAWFADDSARVTQVDQNGVKSVTTIQNWKASGIPAFITTFSKDKLFFRTAPNL